MSVTVPKQKRPRQDNNAPLAKQPRVKAVVAKNPDPFEGEDPKSETDMLWRIPLRPTLTPVSEIPKAYPRGSAGWLGLRFGV